MSFRRLIGYYSSETRKKYEFPTTYFCFYGFPCLAFEQLCKDHVEQIKRSISIAGVLSEQSSWFSKKEESDNGTQIDMLIDRRDRVINICEMKFSINEFTIDKDYDAVLRNRMAVFKQETKTTKALHITMITTFGVKRNAYSNIVQSQVLLDDLFLAK